MVMGIYIAIFAIILEGRLSAIINAWEFERILMLVIVLFLAVQLF
jgi:hypothetical protein